MSDEQEFLELFSLVKSAVGRISRSSIVGLMFLLAFWCAGASFLKSLLIAFIAALSVGVGVGAGWFERIGVLAFLLAMFSWTQILPVERWTHAAIALVDRLLL